MLFVALASALFALAVAYAVCIDEGVDGWFVAMLVAFALTVFSLVICALLSCGLNTTQVVTSREPYSLAGGGLSLGGNCPVEILESSDPPTITRYHNRVENWWYIVPFDPTSAGTSSKVVITVPVGFKSPPATRP